MSVGVPSKVSLPQGKFVRVDGPGHLRVLQGEITVRGKTMKLHDTLVVPRSKAAVIEANSNSVVEVKLGQGGNLTQVEDSAIPIQWTAVMRRVLEASKPVKVAAMGETDSGKSTFCTILANHCLDAGFKTAVIEKDLGQSELGPPTTIALGYVRSPILTLGEVPIVDAHFVGSTSPAGFIHRIVVGLRRLVDRAIKDGEEVIIVNTSGWIHGWEARELKSTLMHSINPDLVVAIQKGGELEHALRSMNGGNGHEVLRLPAPPSLRSRSREDRKILREASYIRYLKDASTRTISLDKIGLHYALYGSGFQVEANELRDLETRLGSPIVYCEKGADFMLIITEKKLTPSQELIEGIRSDYAREEIVVLPSGEEKGLLVGLAGRDKNFLGIGVIQKIDYPRHVMHVYTPAKEEVGGIYFGQIKLKDDGQEITKIEGWPL
jgi:polynucleotide 5'-hydroxyl-kinase GRC3/NOL9